MSTAPTARPAPPASTRSRASFLPLLVPLLGVVLAIAATASVLILPRPLPDDADPARFSAHRAMRHVETLADEPHSVPDTEAHDRARDDVVGMFRDLGYEPEIHADPMILNTWSGMVTEADRAWFRPIEDLESQNIVVRVPGASQRTLMLTAHYDSAASQEGDQVAPGDSHGAGDDGYGVATIIETLRALKAQGRQPENSLLIVITDAEEVGMVGALNEVTHHREALDDVELIVNLEARGMSGPALMFETSQNNSAVMRRFLADAPNPVTTSFLPTVYRNMPNGTDLSVYLDEGFTGLNIAAISGGEHYHHATDAPEHANAATLQHYGDQVLGLTQAWLYDADASGLTADHDLHYFPLWRGMMVGYPEAVGLGIAAAALILGALAAWGLRPWRVRDALRVCWGMVWRSALIAVAATGLHYAIGFLGWGAMPGGVGPNPLLLWEFLGMVALGGAWLGRFIWRHRQEPAAAAAVVEMLMVATLACAVWAPGLSYIAALSLAALAVSLLVRGRAALLVRLLAAFAIALVFGLPIVLLHEAMSVNLLALPVIGALLPLGPLALVCARDARL